MPTLAVAIDARRAITGAAVFNRALKGMASAATSALGAVAALTVVIVATAAATITAGKSFAQFDDQLRLIQVSSNATASSIKAIRDESLELGATTRFTATEVAGGFLELAKSGQSAEESLKTLPPVLALAAANMSNLRSVTAGVLGVMGQFGIDVKFASDITDILQFSATKSAATLEDMFLTLKRAGPVARLAGVSFQETSAAMIVLGRSQIRGSVASTGFTNAIRSLTKVTPAGVKELERLKLTTADVDVSVIGVAKAFETLNAAIETGGGSPIASINELFTKLGAPAAGVFLRTADEMRGLTDEMETVGGVAQNAARHVEQGLGGGFRRVTAAMNATAITIGDSLEPELLDLLDTVVSVTKEFGKWVTESDNVRQALGFIVILAGDTARAIGSLSSNLQAFFLVTSKLFLSNALEGLGIPSKIDDLLDELARKEASRQIAADERAGRTKARAIELGKAQIVVADRLNNRSIKSQEQIELELLQLQRLQEAYQTTADIVSVFGNASEDAFFAAVKGGEDFKEAMRKIAESVIRDLFRILVTQRLVAGFTGLLAGDAPTSSNTGLGVQSVQTQGNFQTIPGRSKGGFAERFGHGGIFINQRTRLGPNAVGGEGGRKEMLVLPVGSDASGEVGIRGGGGTSIVMNIQTPDADGFRLSKRLIVDSVRRQFNA